MMPEYHKPWAELDVVPALLPESGIPVAFKYALLEHVVVWALDCGHKIVAKPEWMEYWDDGVRKEQMVCPYCKHCDANLIYLTPSGTGLIGARGIKAADVRCYSESSMLSQYGVDLSFAIVSQAVNYDPARRNAWRV